MFYFWISSLEAILFNIRGLSLLQILDIMTLLIVSQWHSSIYRADKGCNVTS